MASNNDPEKLAIRKSKLTAKKRHFCKVYVKNKHNATDAAFQAYNSCSRESASSHGCLLLAEECVQDEIRRLEAALAYTTDDCILENEEYLTLARQKGNLTAIQTGIEFKAKLKGLLIDRQEIISHDEDTLTRAAGEAIQRLVSSSDSVTLSGPVNPETESTGTDQVQALVTKVVPESKPE